MICAHCGTSLSNKTIVQGIAICTGCMSMLPEEQQLPRPKVVHVDFHKIVTKPVADVERR